MKITQEHFQHIKNKVSILESEYHRTQYRDRKIAQADKVKDINTRYRWDLFHAAGLTSFACDHLYSYLNDEHIDTALRSIVKPL